MGNIKSDTTKSFKNLAKHTAKQVVKEPYEILEGAGRQVTGLEIPKNNNDNYPEGKSVTEEDSIKLREDKIRSKRLIEALEKEIEDIRKTKESKEEQKVIGEQKQKEEVTAVSEPQVSTKPSRRLVGGIKGKIDKLKRKSEIRLPPSG